MAQFREMQILLSEARVKRSTRSGWKPGATGEDADLALLTIADGNGHAMFN